MELENLLPKIHTLISDDKTYEAIQLLKALKLTPDFNSRLTIIAGRFKSIQKQFQAGTISTSEKNIEENKIRSNIISLLQEYDQEKRLSSMGRGSGFSEKPQKSSSFKIITIIAVTIGIFLSTALLINALNFGNNQKLEIQDDQLTGLAQKIYYLQNPKLNPSDREQVVNGLIKIFEPETVVYIKAKNGTILDVVALEHFLKSLEIGTYKNFHIQDLQKEEIVIQYY